MPEFLPAPGHVTVIVVDPALIPEESTTACLSAAEQEQAARFHFEKDARHWRACRTALRRILGAALEFAPADLSFHLGAHGKPHLPPPRHGLHFNLSHCRDLALVALCQTGPVGINLEPADRAPTLIGCEPAFCHPDEIAQFPTSPDERAARLLDLWTSKESLLKALGTGLSLPPESVSLATGNASDHPLLRDFTIHRLDHPRLRDHIARLAAPHETLRIGIFEFTA